MNIGTIKVIRAFGLLLLLAGMGSALFYAKTVSTSGRVVARAEMKSSNTLKSESQRYSGALRKIETFELQFFPVRLTSQMDEIKFRLTVDGPSLTEGDKFRKEKMSISIVDAESGANIPAHSDDGLSIGSSTTKTPARTASSYDLAFARVPKDGSYFITVKLDALSIEGRTFKLIAIQGAEKYRLDYWLVIGGAVIVGVLSSLLTRKYVYGPGLK